MDFNEIFKKFTDATLGMASVAAEKMVEFTDTMSKKGQEFKETKKEDIEAFFAGFKKKLEETSESVASALRMKSGKLEELEKEVAALKETVEALKKKAGL